MTKARTDDAPHPTPVTCPHCGMENAPAMYPTDWLVFSCGYCGKLILVSMRDGEMVTEKTTESPSKR